MVLMSWNLCHLCKMFHAEFSELTQVGEPLEYTKMEEIAKAHQANTNMKPNSKPKQEMKDSPWWTIIPLNHITVPLIHCLIGRGDDPPTKFRYVIYLKIEYVLPTEVDILLLIGTT